MSREKKIKTAFSAKKVARRVDDLAREIRKDAGKADIFLLGVLKGTSCFLADLVRAMPGNVSVIGISLISA